MGFVPIVLTLGAAILLFVMAVNQTILSKKNTLLDLQANFISGMEKLGVKQAKQPSIDKDTFQWIDQQYQQLKGQTPENKMDKFEQNIRKPYQSIKLKTNQYNQLVSKKPYSFVAALLGHRPIA